MERYQELFLKLAINEEAILSTDALLFGDFTLKSGRQSPYFFQAGTFNNGLALQKVGEFLAHAINDYHIEFNHLFGPAYKGIPLVSATAIALTHHYGQNYPWSFNRKIVKNYGEGGSLVGAKLQDKVLIVDDVLTAGTAVGESIELIKKESNDTQVCGVLTLLDRCEVVAHGKSAKKLIEEKFNIPVYSVISIHHVLEYLHYQNRRQEFQAIEKHLQQYGEQ